MKTRIEILRAALALFAFGGFGLARPAVAVVPAPDGGYPGGNTAEGQNALLSLNVTTGTNNTAVGWFSLRSNVQGDFNTAVGSGALTTSIGDGNTALGGAALFSNTTGGHNTAIGLLALFHNTTASYNTAIGDSALSSNTAGFGNTATGSGALLNNTQGSDNTAFGLAALRQNATGSSNTASGVRALLFNTTGEGNTATGRHTLFSNTEGIENTAAGISALANNTAGNGNTAIGAHALEECIDGDINTALGRNAGLNVSTASNVICIGAGAVGANVSSSCYIANIWNQPGGSQAVYVNSDGKLGAQVSSRRFKDDIKPINQASKAIYGLRPVSFRYKSEIEPTRPLCFGLIAEEVGKVSPDLVTRDKDGKPLSVRYDQVNAMLLNEFLKEHQRAEAQQRKIEKQEATIAELKSAVAQQQKGMDVLAARLKEQTERIQKVSAQVEITKRIPQLASGHP